MANISKEILPFILHIKLILFRICHANPFATIMNNHLFPLHDSDKDTTAAPVSKQKMSPGVIVLIAIAVPAILYTISIIIRKCMDIEIREFSKLKNLKYLKKLRKKNSDSSKK
ncbi:hypothetical protein RF11_02408 [Thelohanellus kitauei]|uniref:Uncharacterized protein n=1 Tax=Thelohanellus kitauei TaxID=669202 RepID=A0A0C2MWF4_THEKT|nr:hypothetical protein RF11_02408 [Thelohanellus kitauei]